MPYLRPQTVEEALAALAGKRYTVLAGGTDLYAAQPPALAGDVIDISRLAELRGIREEESHWRIGALTTWTDVVRAKLPPLLRALQEAGREVGGVQVQNAGTVGGNLCNASPAADGIPVLMALDAEVELAGSSGMRRLALERFVTGNRRTLRAPDELLTAVLVPKAAPGSRAGSCFLKLGARRYLVISIVAVAVRLALDSAGRIAQCGIAVGACASTARRLRSLELALTGQPVQAQVAELVTPKRLAELSPIDDVRGTAEYRLQAAGELIRRGLKNLLDEAAGGALA